MVRNEAHVHLEERQDYKQLLKTCLSISLEQDLIKLDSLKRSVAHLSAEFHQQVDFFKQKISTMPFFAFILLWAERMCQDKIYGSRHLTMMNDLMETRLLSVVSNENKAESLQDLSQQDPSLIIDKIRCYKEWSIIKREDYVLLYRNFSEWLSKETCGYIPEARDADRLATHKRLVPFEIYIEILSHLDLRERILAKMFYLGGHRGLEEVLSIKIEDIDPLKGCILFSEHVFYSKHLFDDIEAYKQDRKKGFLFLGKDGERIAHTTPFRALKKVVSELKLDPEFTFRELTKNI